MNSAFLSGRILTALTVFLFIGIFMSGCGGDDSSTGPSATMADVNTYMNSLPEWDNFCPPVADADGPTGATVENIDGGLFCRTTPCSITQTPEQVVTYGTFSNILWLGALIQGDSYAGGLGSMEELPIRQRAPLKIGVNFLTGDSISTTVYNPDPTTVGQAIGTLISNAVDSGYHGGSSVYFTQKRTYSVEQAALSLGLSAKYMGASIKNKLDLSSVQQKNTLMAYFKQFMFETYIVLPQTPADMFSDAFTEDVLQQQVSLGYIGPDNLPVYVARIQWGRIMLLTMSSDSSVVDMTNALKATYGSFGVTMNAKYQSILANSEMEVVTFGGDDADALALIRSGDISTYFTDSPDLVTAFPIGYVLNNLADNSVAKVGETTTYEVKECVQATASFYTDWTQWKNAFSVIPDSTINIYFETNGTNLLLSPELQGWWVPAINAHLGHATITFPPENTGYDFAFALTALQLNCPYPLTFDDDEFSGAPSNIISIGDVGNCEDDDFQIVASDFRDSCYIFAVGTIVGNNGEYTAEEKLEVFYGDQKIAEYPNHIDGFIGVVSAVPITKFKFNEDSGDNDIWIRDFCFGVAYRK
nr:thiol-activated cytolysin family protein [candidate division Zixibacteria bacterium]